MPQHSITRMRPDEWDRVRATRLRALTDAPDAFGTTFAEDEVRPLAEWRTRLENADAATFLASDHDRDVGIAVGFGPPGQSALATLNAMWVAPEARGLGLGRALVDAVIDWARGAGYQRLLLEVATENAPAVSLYARMGFEPNGVVGSLPPPREHVVEHQRELPL